MVFYMSRRICVKFYKYLRELPGCPGGGGDDRLGERPGGLPAAHPEQGQAGGTEEALPGSRRPLKVSDRPGYVAHRVAISSLPTQTSILST